MLKSASFCLISLVLLSTAIFYSNSAKCEMEPKIGEIRTIPDEPATLTFATMVFTPSEVNDLLARFELETGAQEQTEPERTDTIRYEPSSEAANAGGYSASYFKLAGVIHWNGWRWTWYSERILPGYGLRIPGRHTDAQGFVRDGDGLLCLATDVLRRGTVMDTPFGLGKVYDCGCGSTIDVYVGW